ncbi:MAG TPA: YggU family protein [Pseudomonas pachastrellae]|nr:YggU family protein [Halopseudomonas pachastrellae]
MPFYHWQGEHLLLDCHLQPGAKRAEFAGQHGERLKIRISAPPVDGKANDALIRFLADAFAVSRQQVSLLSGQSSRQKRLLIQTPRQLPTELGIQRR